MCCMTRIQIVLNDLNGQRDLEGHGRKYTIESDTGKNFTRTRHCIRPDGSYVTNSGCVSKPPERLILKM